jgi:hypothetical protein
MSAAVTVLAVALVLWSRPVPGRDPAPGAIQAARQVPNAASRGLASTDVRTDEPSARQPGGEALGAQAAVKIPVQPRPREFTSAPIRTPAVANVFGARDARVFGAAAEERAVPLPDAVGESAPGALPAPGSALHVMPIRGEAIVVVPIEIPRLQIAPLRSGS